jgi:hypothetical protein
MGGSPEASQAAMVRLLVVLFRQVMFGRDICLTPAAAAALMTRDARCNYIPDRV